MQKTLGAVALLAALVAVCLASVAFGSGIGPHDVGPMTALDAVFRSSTVSDDIATLVDNRVARTLLGLFVGLALGAAGALTQGHTRNPLADPGLLGINAGAACAVVTGVFAFGVSSPLASTGLALIGAGLAAAAVFVLADVTGGSPLTLVLAGTGLSAFLTAVTSAIVLSDGASLDVWRAWNVGSLSGRESSVLWTAAPFIIVGLLLALSGGWFLNLLSLGDDMAAALGGRVLLIRVTGILTIMLLAGASTAACGPIVFLGLVVPHLARAVTGPDYRWIVPYSALIGALMLLACDVVGRVIARPGEVQVGVTLALVGAPALMLMVRRKRLPTV
ncbi:MAG: iron ABC transporter permease [Gordonia sp. (in: high G+C Gram-positive bacteria)]